MKLEILKKLIALANNNPNDNEANLAARRVCKALTEFKYLDQLIDKSAPPKKTTTATYGGFSGFTDMNSDLWEDRFRDIFGGGRSTGPRKPPPKQEQPPKQEYYEYKVYKSQELKDRENNWQYEYYNMSTRQYENPLTKGRYNKMFQDLWYEETGTRHNSDTAAFRAGVNYGYTPSEEKSREDEYEKRRKERGFGNDIRRIRCKTCGKTVETKFVGLADVFECNSCQWTAFTGKRPESTFQRTCDMCKSPITCTGGGYCNIKGTVL